MPPCDSPRSDLDSDPRLAVALDGLRLAVDDFEPAADFRLLRAARAVLAASGGPE